MSNAPEFLVFGATGQQGGAVTRALLEAGRGVRAFVRDPYSEKAKSLAADGVSLAVGDLFDRASIDHAMKGIRSVFSVQTSSPSGLLTDEQEVEQGKSIADSTVSNGVAYLVYSSTGLPGRATPVWVISTASLASRTMSAACPSPRQSPAQPASWK